jgi:hypothetical protein
MLYISARILWAAELILPYTCREKLFQLPAIPELKCKAWAECGSYFVGLIFHLFCFYILSFLFQTGVCFSNHFAQSEKVPACGKQLVFNTNISAEILPHILRYRFCAECHIFVHFCHMLLPLKKSKIIYAKAILIWH